MINQCDSSRILQNNSILLMKLKIFGISVSRYLGISVSRYLGISVSRYLGISVPRYHGPWPQRARVALSRSSGQVVVKVPFSHGPENMAVFGL